MNQLKIIFAGLMTLLWPSLSRAEFSGTDNLSWVGRMTDVIFEVVSGASLEIYKSMQELSKPLLAFFFAFWLVLFAGQLIWGDYFGKKIKEPVKTLFKRIITFAFCYALLSVSPKVIFEYTFTPLVQISTSFSTAFFAKYDTHIQDCMASETERIEQTGGEYATGVLDRDTLSGLTCITESATRTLQSGVRLGWWMVGSGAAQIGVGFLGMAIILPAALLATGGVTLVMGLFLIYKCTSIILEILWMLISLAIELGIAIMLTPLAFMGRVFEGEEKEETGWYASTPLTKLYSTVFGYFQNAFIGIVIWSIAMTVLVFMFNMAFSFIQIDLGDGFNVAWDQLDNTSDNMLYDEDGNFQHWAMIKMANTMLFNIKAWFLLIVTLLLGEWIFEKFKTMAEGYANTEGGKIVINEVKGAYKKVQSGVQKNAKEVFNKMKKKP